MSTGNENRQRKRSTRVRRPEAAPTTRQSTSGSDVTSPDHVAREHYRREKARRAERIRPAEHPLEQARRAYHALLAADAERAKGGRPKKVIVATKEEPTDTDESEKE